MHRWVLAGVSRGLAALAIVGINQIVSGSRVTAQEACNSCVWCQGGTTQACCAPTSGSGVSICIPHDNHCDGAHACS